MYNEKPPYGTRGTTMREGIEPSPQVNALRRFRRVRKPPMNLSKPAYGSAPPAQQVNPQVHDLGGSGMPTTRGGLVFPSQLQKPPTNYIEPPTNLGGGGLQIDPSIGGMVPHQSMGMENQPTYEENYSPQVVALRRRLGRRGI